MQLKNIFNFLLISFVFILSCEGDDELNSCLGCGIDTNFYDVEYTIKGRLLDNCTNQNGVVRQLEFYNLISSEYIDAFMTDSIGQFEISYIIPTQNQSLGGDIQSLPHVIKVGQDSTFFIVPSRRNIENLTLTLYDSVDTKIYFDFSNKPLTATDSIFYSFGHVFAFSDIGVTIPEYKINGPINAADTLINRITDRWRVVNIDEDGHVYHRIHWGEKGNYGDTESTSKKPCVIRTDSVYIVHN